MHACQQLSDVLNGHLKRLKDWTITNRHALKFSKKSVLQRMCNERVLTSNDKQNCFLSSLLILSSSMSQ